MSSTNAATRVFGIPELLEQIILSIPESDGYAGDDYVRGKSSIGRLFALKGVNRSFHNTITWSLKIQRRMSRMCEPTAITWVQTAPLWWSHVVWPKGIDVHAAWQWAVRHGSRPEETWRGIKFLRDDDHHRKVVFDHGIRMYVDPGETYGRIVDRLHTRRSNQLRSLEWARRIKKRKSARRAKWTKVRN
ncbi:hypothetical protein HII31_03967 [Pseudocercospora fuligena]|uniref:Uncharacterized protein n=1 Tax=Pseudocercospora fuligena TaxID=685502 RepID=A0A8H6VQ10_9PEZI|nr:hypothetical protein HII31_03967 [Pseudocercospora fuligena]